MLIDINIIIENGGIRSAEYIIKYVMVDRGLLVISILVIHPM